MRRTLLGVLLLLTLSGIHPCLGLAQLSPTPEQQRRELKQAVEATFGSEYYVDYFVDVDHALKTDPQRFFDPQGTLENAIVFSAQKDPQVVVGVYRDGSIIWSDQWERTRCVFATGFLRAEDLNDDDAVELVYTGDGCRQFGATRLWIYSWDGQDGTFLSANRLSVQTDVRSTAEFVDLTGDGIPEIVGWQGGGPSTTIKDGEPVRTEPEMERIAYSWNGQKYGQWPSTPDPPEDDDKYAMSVSSDLMTVQVETSVRPVSADTLRYRYKVENDESSRQPLEYIFVAGDSTSQSMQPEVWSDYHSPYDDLKWWLHAGNASQYLRPGDQDFFSYASPGLPVIGPMYVLGHPNGVYRTLTNLSRSEWEKQVYGNSVSLRTISARYPPDASGYQRFLDTLRTYPDRARQQGWITTDAAASRYEQKLNAAYDHLAAADSALAQQALSEVAAQAQADSGDVLTSEGYALLYYNADYLARRLPASAPGCGQVPATAEVDFETTSVWDTGYNAQITLTNDGDIPIRGWTLDFALEAPINSLWNGQLAGEAPTYTVADDGYNAVIAPGQSRSFGFQVQGDGVMEPTGYALNAVDCATDAPSVDIAFETTSVWGTGYNAQIAMTNTGDEPIRGWRLGFALEAPIASLWNGQLTGEAPTYTVTDAGHNGVLAPGQTVTFGFQVQSDTVREPSDYAFQFWAVGP